MTILRWLLFRLWMFLATLIVLAAVFLTVARIVTPFLGNYRSNIENWVEDRLAVTLTIGEMEAIWHGLNPAFKFSQVQIQNPENKSTVMEIDTLYFGINLWQSLMHLRIYTGDIIVDGAHLTIIHEPDGRITLSGLKKAIPPDASQRIDYKEALAWAFNRNHLAIKNVTIDFFQQDGTIITFTDVVTNLKNKGQRHLFQGEAKLSQEKPTLVTFTFSATGTESELKGNFNLAAKGVSLRPWRKLLPFTRIALKSGMLDLQIEGRIRRGDLTRLFVQSSLQNVDLHSKQTSARTMIEMANAQITWEKMDETTWQLLADKILFRIHGKDFLENRISVFSKLNKATGQREISISLGHFKAQLLQAVSEWITLSPEHSEAIAKLNPSGTLSDIAVLLQKNDNNISFSTGFSFDNLSFNAWGKIPGALGLHGRLDMDDKAGALTFDSHSVVLTFPGLFRAPLALDTFQADASWQKKQNVLTVSIPHFYVNNHLATIGGRLQLSIPDNGVPSIEMLAKLVASQIKNEDVQTFLPVGIMSPDVIKWLDDSIEKIDALQASMVLRGNLPDFPFENNSGTFLIEAGFKGAVLDYAPQWPVATALDGELRFAGNRMNAWVTKGSISGMDIVNLKADIPALSTPDAVILNLQGNAAGNVSHGLDFLRIEPLKDVIGSSVHNIQGTGEMNVNLDLMIPLTDIKEKIQNKVAGEVNLKNAHIHIPFANISSNISDGNLSFTQDSLTSDKIETVLFGFPATVSIGTLHPDTKDTQTDIELKGMISSKAILDQYNIDVTPFVKGQTLFEAQLYFKKDTLDRIVINSDLSGLASQLPPPFDKMAEQKFSATTTLQRIDENTVKMDVILGKKASAIFNFKKQAGKWQLQGGSILIGEEGSHNIPDAGVRVSGNVEALDLGRWLNFMKKQGLTETSNQKMKEVLLKVNQLNVAGFSLKDVLLDLKREAGGWSVGVTGEEAEGQLFIPEEKSNLQPIQANFTKLLLPVRQNTVSSKKTELTNPTTIPPFKLYAQNFTYANREFGKVKIVGSKIQNGIHFDEISASNQSYSLNSVGQWVMDGADVFSQFNGTLHSSNLSETLKRWQISENIHSKNSQLLFNIKWPGAPKDFAVSDLIGNVRLSIQDGVYAGLNQDANSKMGLGRLVTVLSLESIFKRVQFNFSDLTHEGYYFDSLHGDFKLSAGNAFTENLQVEAMIADVKVKGRIGLSEKDYDMILTVIPNLTSSLPVIATLAAGPVAGVLTFVVDKTVGTQVNKISSSQYKIIGTFSDPVVLPLNRKIQQPKSKVNSKP